MRSFIIIILLFFISVSCEEPVSWTLDDPVTPRLVVEGMLTNRPGLNYVRLSLPVKNPNREPGPVNNALVVLSDGENYHQLTRDPEEPGLYLPDPSLSGVVNSVYWLYIAVGEYEFLAAAYMVPVTPIKDLVFYKDGDKAGYYRIYPRESNAPSFIEYNVQWEENNRTEKSVFYSYTLSTIDVNQLFKPAAENLSFPAGARVIRTKYSLSPEHERFLRSLLSETDWRGGWFDVMHGNLHTNLNNGAVGFFAACSVVQDTTYIE